MYGMRIFLPKLSMQGQYELLTRLSAHGQIPSCATIEALRQPKNPYTPATIATQARHFLPFEIWSAAHVLVQENDRLRVYDIPAQFLTPYNLANYPSRRIEKYTFLNLPVDIRVGDKLFVAPRAFKQLA
jgi:hypothetical protein